MQKKEIRKGANTFSHHCTCLDSMNMWGETVCVCVFVLICAIKCV